jgi:HAD superfamily hydrolase (TIGR01509 family)
MTKAIFFDVANTLLYKPSLFEKMVEVFKNHGLTVDPDELAYKHKILSEALDFPDKTNEHFYRTFNSQIVLSLGIEPADQLLSELFKNCSYLPWRPFEDTEVLSSLKIPFGIISNWDNRLEHRLKENFAFLFKWILGSEETGLRKPDERFFMKMLENSDFRPDEIMMVGDSIRLDIAPAVKLGMRAVLVDRIDVYPNTPFEKINSLVDIVKLIQ